MSRSRLDIDLTELGREGAALVRAALEMAVALERSEDARAQAESWREWLQESFRLLLDGQRTAKLEAAWYVLEFAMDEGGEWAWELVDKAAKAVPHVIHLSVTEALGILEIPPPAELLEMENPPVDEPTPEGDEHA